MTTLDFLNENIRIGCHIGKSGTLLKSVFNVLGHPITCAQIYLGTSRGYAIPVISKDDIMLTRSLVEYSQFNVFVHSCLLYNLNGATHIDNIDELISNTKSLTKLTKLKEEKTKIPYNYQSTIDGLTAELDICADAFGTGVVVHIGSGEIRDKALVRIPKTIEKVLQGSKKRHIILENAAGEGNKLGSILSELKEIHDRIDTQYHPQVSFCIDTCHLYAAGEYDIEKVSELKRFLKDFDNAIGIKKLKLFHLNDSKGKFGCKKDRHENIGCGFIFGSAEGQRSLKFFVNFCNKNKIDMILETPVSIYSEFNMDVNKIIDIC